MKKLAVSWTALMLVIALMSVCAYAEETVFRTTVPSFHTLSIAIYGNGSVFVNGKEYKQSANITVPRQKDIQVEIKSDTGWCIQRAEYNSLTLSGQIFSRSVTIPSVNADGILAVQFGRTVVTGVKTGDDAQPILWLCILMASAVTSIALLKKLKHT